MSTGTLRLKRLQYPNGTNALTIDSDGSLTAASGTLAVTGNTTVGGTLVNTGLITASAGVAVGGTGSANTIDDYEEGAWVPTLRHEADTNLNPTYNATYTRARYVKLGPIVYIQFTVNLTNISGEVSNQQPVIDNLPFTAKAYTDNSNGGAHVTYQTNVNTDVKYGMVLGSSTRLRFYSATSTPSYSNFLTNTTWLQGYGQYETDS